MSFQGTYFNHACVTHFLVLGTAQCIVKSSTTGFIIPFHKEIIFRSEAHSVREIVAVNLADDFQHLSGEKLFFLNPKFLLSVDVRAYLDFHIHVSWLTRCCTCEVSFNLRSSSGVTVIHALSVNMRMI